MIRIGRNNMWNECPNCNGTGDNYETECEICGGHGGTYDEE